MLLQLRIAPCRGFPSLPHVQPRHENKMRLGAKSRPCDTAKSLLQLLRLMNQSLAWSGA